MLDFPSFLCCLNLANIYCLEITSLIITILLCSLILFGMINIKWKFIEYFCQILYSINLPALASNIIITIFIILSTTSRKILLSNYYNSFAQVSLMTAYIFLFVFVSLSICAFFILKNYYKIKNGTYVFKKINKYEIKEIKAFVNDKRNWMIICIINFVPIFFSLLNILLWVSIYYRISFRIYCSFNYEIRKELRKAKQKNTSKLAEENINGNDKNKNTKIEKVEISVVFQKDRHPVYKKNLKKTNDLKLSLKNMEDYKEELPTDGISSSKRRFDRKINI